jgi:hypothetical protein
MKEALPYNQPPCYKALSTIDSPRVIVAETANGFPPVAIEAQALAARAAHRTGYLITGGVQSIIIPLQAFMHASVGDVHFYTSIEVFAKPYPEPITGAFFRRPFTIIASPFLKVKLY